MCRLAGVGLTHRSPLSRGTAGPTHTPCCCCWRRDKCTTPACSLQTLNLVQCVAGVSCDCSVSLRPLTQVLGPQASVSRGPGTGPLYGTYGQGQASVFVRIVRMDGTLVCLSKVSSTQACHTNCLTFLNCIFNACFHELSDIILLAKSWIRFKAFVRASQHRSPCSHTEKLCNIV